MRSGVAFVSGFVEAPKGAYVTDPALLGVTGHVGAQLDERFALFFRGTLVAVWLQLRAAVLVEWTPVDAFSIGVGPEIGWVNDVSADADVGAGGTLRLAANVPYSRGLHGRRRAVTFEIDTTTSYARYLYGLAFRGFQLTLLAGVGLEFY